MEREETKKIIAVMMSAYPNYHPSDLSGTVDTWTLMLQEYSYNVVAMSLKAYIQSDTSGFAPAVGQIIDKIQSITQPEPLNDMEAWSLVSKALKNGYYGAETEFEKLPVAVQQAVGSPQQLRNWAVTDSKSIENVVQSNFMRTYNTVVKRLVEKQRMSQDVRALIDKTNENRPQLYVKSDAPAIEDKRETGVPMPESVKNRLNKMFEGEMT